VLGAGTIGLLVLQVARASGAGQVLITAKRSHRLKLRAQGADGIILTDADLQAEVAQCTGGKGVDCVIETVGGNAPTPQLAMGVARKRGCIVIVGAFVAPQPFDFRTLVMKEPEVVGSHTYDCGPDMRRDFEVSLGLVASGRVKLDRFT